MKRSWLALVCSVFLAAPGSPGVAAAPEQWSPPVDGPVVRGYEAPERPFGPRHLGIDFAARPGTPVRAAGDGIVAFSGRVGKSRAVAVEHPGARRSTYAYLAPHPGAARGAGPPGRHAGYLRCTGARPPAGRRPLRLPGRRRPPGPGAALRGRSSHLARPCRPTGVPRPSVTLRIAPAEPAATPTGVHFRSFPGVEPQVAERGSGAPTEPASLGGRQARPATLSGNPAAPGWEYSRPRSIGVRPRGASQRADG